MTLAHAAGEAAFRGLAALGGGAVDVDFDRSFLVQMVAFALLCAVLKPLLFDPLLRVWEERERRTEGARKEARQMDEKAGDLLKKYEAELERVRRVAVEEREKLRAEALRLEGRILAEARADAAKVVADGRERIARETAALRADLEKSVPDLARHAASRVLGREVHG